METGKAALTSFPSPKIQAQRRRSPRFSPSSPVLGFGLPCAYGLWYFAKHHSIWTFLGFPTYGGGPFERIGLATSVPLLAGFLIVCLAEVIVGGLLLAGQPAALWLSLALLPFETAYWLGFALPFGPPLAVVRTILVIAALRA